MNNPITQFKTHPYETVLITIAVTCTVLFISAVVKSFSKFHTHRTITKEKRSLVTTFTMFLFFFLYLGLFHLRFLTLPFTGIVLKVQQMLGAILLIFSTIVNILGRKNLGKQWGDQIRIYDKHTFVRKGWYKIVRHPLYASTIWAFIAGSLIYNNGGALIATIIIFIPMMSYRANQEEILLKEKFPEYADYQKSTGRFFPKIMWRKI